MKRFSIVTLITLMTLSGSAFAGAGSGGDDHAAKRKEAEKNYGTANDALTVFETKYAGGTTYPECSDLISKIGADYKSNLESKVEKYDNLKEDLSGPLSYLNSSPPITIMVNGKPQSVPAIVGNEQEGFKLNPKVSSSQLADGMDSKLKTVNSKLAEYNKIKTKKDALGIEIGQKAVAQRRKELTDQKEEYANTFEDENKMFEDELSQLASDTERKYAALCKLHKKCKKAEKKDKACIDSRVAKVNAANVSDTDYPKNASMFSEIQEGYDLEIKEIVAGTPNDEGVLPDGTFHESDVMEIEEANNTSKSCDVWAKHQTNKNEQVMAMRADEIEKDNVVQMDYGTPGTPSEENPQIKKDVKDQLIGQFEYKDYCPTNVFKDGYIKDAFDTAVANVASGIESYTVASQRSTSTSRAFIVEDNRRIPIPSACVDDSEEDSYFVDQDYSFFTDFSKDAISLLSEPGKKRACEGTLYQPDENGIICNDIFKVAVSCAETNSPLIVKGTQETFDFDTIPLAQVVTANDEVDPSQSESKKLAFSTVKNCKTFMINKFKQCIGARFKKANVKLNESTDPKIQVVEWAEEEKDKPVEVEVANQEHLQKKLEREVNIQYGACIAFRKVAQEIASEIEPWTPGEKTASADGRVICQRVTPWTLDYKACKNLANTQSGFMVGDMARNVGGQGWSMVRQNQIRNESQDQITGANQNGTLKPGDEGYVAPQENQVNVALDAQKKMYEHQKNKETMNLGFHSAHAGTMTTLLTTYPTPNKIGRQSEDHPYLKTVIEISNVYPAVKEELFANQKARKSMWGQVMESAASATLAALKASQYKKMANDVQTYKNAFNDLNKDATSSSSTLEVGYCSLNPTAPGCTNTGPRVMGNSQFSYGSIGAQNASGGAIDFNNDEGNLGAFDEEQLTQSQQTAIDDLGSVIDQDSAGSFGSGIEKKVGAGKFSRSPASGGGGGGGGGGAGGGGSAYNGGGAGGGSGGNNSAFGGAKQKVSYGAGSGRIKYSASGSGSSKKSSNPFSSLFGKKKGRKVASKVTNDIAPSHSGLFDKISKRYSKMQQADRLHKLK
jgi:hypothetical protein